MKIAFICDEGEAQFVPSVAKHIGKSHEIREAYTRDGQTVVEAIQWADIVWLEWAGPMSIMITGHDTLLDGKKVILRLHSSEAVNGYLEHVKWDKVDSVVFVAQHIQDIAMGKIKALTETGKRLPKAYLIPNGIDLDEWKLYDEPGWSPDIAWAPGQISWRKGAQLALQSLAGLTQQGRSWRIHVAGVWVEERERLYTEALLKELGIEENMIFYGYVKGIQEWYHEMSFVASFSNWEGNPVVLMEAMATGLRPLVHNFPGSRDQYSPLWIWNTIPELVGMVHQHVVPADYRDYVINHWDAKDQMHQVDKVFLEVMEVL